MDLFTAIRQRRSARKFKSTPIPEEIIHEMLEAARLSPSGGNAQGYVFGVVADPTVKMKLAEAAGDQMWIATAPVVFACCADISWDIASQPEDDFGIIVNNLRFGTELMEYMKKFPDRKACMTLFEDGTPLIPMEHIFLTAVSHGLSACFIGYLDIEKANGILNLPDHLTCLYLLPVGYADEKPVDKIRKSLDEISFSDVWGQ
jgi:nitroreductase